jgi:hypothetical protein
VIPSLGAPCSIPQGTVPASVSNREFESESKTTARAKTVVAASSPTDNSIPDGILEFLSYFGCENGTREILGAKLVPFLDLYSVTDLKSIIDSGRQSPYWASACYWNENAPDKLMELLNGDLPHQWKAAKKIKKKAGFLDDVTSLSGKDYDFGPSLGDDCMHGMMMDEPCPKCGRTKENWHEMWQRDPRNPQPQHDLNPRSMVAKTYAQQRSWGVPKPGIMQECVHKVWLGAACEKCGRVDYTPQGWVAREVDEP